jgi:hypothetical protein
MDGEISSAFYLSTYNQIAQNLAKKILSVNFGLIMSNDSLGDNSSNF